MATTIKINGVDRTVDVDSEALHPAYRTRRAQSDRRGEGFTHSA